MCEHDEDHGGILYVPKRIVENSKDWDYQKADLENFDMEYVEYEDGLDILNPIFRKNIQRIK